MKLADDIAAFTNVVGIDHLGVIWQLANVPWKSDEDRDAFITTLVNMQGPNQ
jgi:hypothetical protein